MDMSDGTVDSAEEMQDGVPSLESVIADRDRLIEEKNDLQDRLLRRQAEFDNFRRRADREKADILEYANTETVRCIMPSRPWRRRTWKITRFSRNTSEAIISVASCCGRRW